MSAYSPYTQLDDYSRRLLDLTHALDQIIWSIEDRITKEGTLDPALHQKLLSALGEQSSTFRVYHQKAIQNPYQFSMISSDMEHLDDKIKRCLRKLQKVRPQMAPQSSLLAIMPATSPVSLKIEEVLEEKPSYPLLQSFEEMIQSLDQKNEERFRKALHILPKAIQEPIHRKMDSSSAQNELNSEDLKAFLTVLKEKIAQIEQTRTYWRKIDTQPSMPDPQKNRLKIGSLVTMAREIVPFFISNKFQAPTYAPSASLKDCANAYIEKYPCLHPFFQELIPNLNLG
jgi:hypothetical protein